MSGVGTQKDLASANIATAPSPATSGLSLVLASGQGAIFPTPPFYATLVDNGVLPTPATAEIVLVTGKSTDTLTIVRAQKNTTAKSVTNTWRIFQGIYVDDVTHRATHLANLAPMPFYSYFNLLNADGSDWYANAGTVDYDNTDSPLGDQSMRIVTDGASSFDGFNFDLPTTLDWSNHRHAIWIKCNDWAHLAEITLVVSTSGFYDEYFQVNLANGISSPENDEWLLVYIDRHNWAVGGGTPDWSTANRFIVRAADTGVTPVTVHASGFGAFPKGPQGYVTIEFDDGWANAYTAGIREACDRFGIKTTQAIIPEALGTTNYMTQAQVDAMHETGHEISGHGAVSLVDLEIASGIDAVEEYVRYVRNWLAEHGYRGQDFFTYPNGNSRDDIREVVGRYFSISRALGVVGQPTSAIQPLKLSARTVVGGSDTATGLNAEIDAAITNGDWLILVFHKIVPGSPSVETEFQTSELVSVLQHIYDNGYACFPRGEVLRRLAGS